MKTILLDLDNSVNDFSGAVIRRVESMGYTFDRANYNTYDIKQYIQGVDGSVSKLFSSICGDIRFWSRLLPLPYSYAVVKWLNERYDVKVCTHPWKQTQEYKQVKIDWVNKYFPFIKDIIFVENPEDKVKIEGDIIIDDNANIIDSCYSSKYTIIKTQPYNKDCVAHARFDKWEEMLDIMEKA